MRFVDLTVVGDAQMTHVCCIEVLWIRTTQGVNVFVNYATVSGNKELTRQCKELAGMSCQCTSTLSTENSDKIQFGPLYAEVRYAPVVRIP
jgi:hypothetical protein